MAVTIATIGGAFSGEPSLVVPAGEGVELGATSAVKPWRSQVNAPRQVGSKIARCETVRVPSASVIAAVPSAAR